MHCVSKNVMSNFFAITLSTVFLTLSLFETLMYYLQNKYNIYCHGITVAQLAERRSLAGELTLSCARPSEDG